MQFKLEALGQTSAAFEAHHNNCTKGCISLAASAYKSYIETGDVIYRKSVAEMAKGLINARRPVCT